MAKVRTSLPLHPTEYNKPEKKKVTKVKGNFQKNPDLIKQINRAQPNHGRFKKSGKSALLNDRDRVGPLRDSSQGQRLLAKVPKGNAQKLKDKMRKTQKPTTKGAYRRTKNPK